MHGKSGLTPYTLSPSSTSCLQIVGEYRLGGIARYRTLSAPICMLTCYTAISSRTDEHLAISQFDSLSLSLKTLNLTTTVVDRLYPGNETSIRNLSTPQSPVKRHLTLVSPVSPVSPGSSSRQVVVPQSHAALISSISLGSRFLRSAHYTRHTQSLNDTKSLWPSTRIYSTSACIAPAARLGTSSQTYGMR